MSFWVISNCSWRRQYWQMPLNARFRFIRLFAPQRDDRIDARSTAGGKITRGESHVPGSVGLAAAIEFLESLDRKVLWKREPELTRYALSRLQEVKGLRILGPTEPKDRVSIFSFVLEESEALDIVKAVDAMGFAVRGGDLASLPLLRRMGVTAAVRASCYDYTTAAEVDLLVAALQKERRGFS